MKKMANNPYFVKKYMEEKNNIYKKASISSYTADELDFDKNGKIQAIEKACDCPIMKEVCYMLATSHEYKKPNTINTISFVRNYVWTKDMIATKNLQGINKPVNQEKVENIAKHMKKVSRLICVDKLNGIKPQSRGKLILIDGHHRKEACVYKGIEEVPIYRGTYKGIDSIYATDFGIPKFSKNRKLYFAFDFDGTIHDGHYDKIGNIVPETLVLMDNIRKSGNVIIIYTCRSGKKIIEMINFLKTHKVPYDYINENPNFETGSRKIYADIYFDDRNMNVCQIKDFLSVDIPDRNNI